MKVVTAEEMREIDRRTIEKIGIPASVLMERAGVAVASRVKELFEKRKTIVLCGGGNNGGDGIVVARELHNAGWYVKALILSKEEKLSPDCLSQFKIAKRIGVPVEFVGRITERDLHSAVVVDALLGTGLKKDLEGNMATVVDFLNNSDTPVLSVDIPSGISSDTGQIMGAAVRANYTVTFGLPKRGHLLYPGAEHAGTLFVENIGFPEELLSSRELMVELPEKRDMAGLIPDRPAYSHKGDYGHVLIVAGSRGKTGAALMAARSCVRAGAGLVTIGVPESLIDIVQSRATEEMTLPLPDSGDGTLSSKAAETILEFLSGRADVLAIGPGIGVSEETEKIMEVVVTSSRAPVVIDADGINSLRDASIFRKAQAPILLTPHPGEMAGLLSRKSGVGSQESGKSETAAADLNLHGEIERDRIGTAQSFSRQTGTYLVLKGVPTIIAEPEGRVFINSTGNPGMASGGTGDVLTGIISSLLGQRVNPLRASILGVYLHGLAGDITAEEKGMHSLIASDIIEALPKAFRELRMHYGKNHLP